MQSPLTASALVYHTMKPGLSGQQILKISRGSASESLRADCMPCTAQGIRVNAINPATVESNFHVSAGLKPEQAAAYLASSAALHPIGRVGVPADVAELCYFLTDTAKSGWLTGQCILLEGGRLLPIPVVQN